MRTFGVHVLVDDDPRWKPCPVGQARAACAGGAAVVQLRAKRSTDREALRMGREIRELTRESGTLFFVNDRFDLALLLGADGVHLGQDDLPPDRLPPEARARLLVGRSTHDDAEVARAMAEPVDYLAFGPIFGTTSKTVPHSARGVDTLRSVVTQATQTPVLAIGGIDVAGAVAARKAGARAVAVISAVAGADDPEAATRALVQAFGAPE